MPRCCFSSKRLLKFILFCVCASIYPLSFTLLFNTNFSSRPVTFNFQPSSSSSEASTFSYTMYGAIPAVFCPPKNQNTSDNSYRFVDQTPKPSDTVGHVMQVQVETSVLFAFSPVINGHVRSMFNKDIADKEEWFTPHPFQVSCHPKNADNLLCAVRVWFQLQKYNSYRNRFQDSYLYALSLDRKLNVKDQSGNFLGIPSPINELWFTGPEDPRLLTINGSMYLNYIMGQFYDEVDATVRHQYLWSLNENAVHDIEIDDYRMNSIEKNWAPLIVKNDVTNSDEVYFVYQLIPVTRILKCNFRTLKNDRRILSCRFVVGKPDDPLNTVKTKNLLLRGGSPFVQYSGDYYLGVTHSVQWLAKGRVYAAQLTLLNMRSYRVVFVSSPIFVDPSTMNAIKGTDPSVLHPFFYARSVFLEENGDSLVMAGGINDAESFLVRLKGFSTLLDEAIATDKKLNLEPSTCDVTSYAYERMLLSGYTSLENWIRKRNIDEIERHKL